jgi:hypothetical protein
LKVIASFLWDNHDIIIEIGGDDTIKNPFDEEFEVLSVLTPTIF